MRSQTWRLSQGPDRTSEGPADAQSERSSPAVSLPPPSPVPTPSPSPSPRKCPLTFNDCTFADITYYSEYAHLKDMAALDTATLQQFQADYPEINPRTIYDIPRDPISQHFAILADAAREGHRSGQYLTPVVENV